MWEVRSPSPPTRVRERRRIQQATQSCNFFNWIVPTFRYVHAVGPEVPQECVSLMTPTFLSDQFDAMYYVPSYRAWFFQQDLRPAYEFHRRFLQHLQFRRAARRRWVLKAPTHMSAMPALLSVYPDALFVQTHRTPLDSMASVLSLMTILRSAFSDAVDPVTVCREAIDYWSDAIEKFLPERDRLADNRICDIKYDEIRCDPISAVRQIYEYSAGHCHAKQSSACALSLQARPKDYPPITDTICRSLVCPLLKCSMPSHRIASGLVFRIPLVCSRNKQLARLRDPIEQQLFENDLRGLPCNPR